MATTTIQFYQSPMVHTSSPYQLPPPRPKNPTIQLSGLAPCLPTPTPSKLSHSSPPHEQRESLSTPVTLAKGPRSSHSQLQSPFFRLPAELRNRIYTHLLCPSTLTPLELSRQRKATTSTTLTDLSVKGFNQTSTCPTEPLHPAILSTCSRIHNEATPLLYTRHTFHAHPSLLTSLPHLFTSTRPVVSPSLTKLITRWQISLRLDTDPRFTYEQVSAAFTGAEYLEVRVWQAQFEACDFDILKLFMGVRGVGYARVGGSVEEKVARGLEELMMSPKESGGEQGCGCEGECAWEWEGKSEMLCGRCYKKVGCGGMEGVTFGSL